MIHVDKENVEASLRLRMIEIREREFNHFLERTRSVATIATIISGLGQFGLLYTKFINHNGCATPICPELLYPFFCVVSTFCSTLTAFVCILLVTHAPAVLLHGTLDRYSECVDSLAREFRVVIVLGTLSVSSFMIAAVVYFWAKFLQHSHRGLHGPHGGGGLGAAQHTWASSFAHGEAIHAVRDLPTALLLSAMLLGCLYVMRLIHVYLRTRVFPLHPDHVVRGSWPGVDEPVPAAARAISGFSRAGAGPPAPPQRSTRGGRRSSLGLREPRWSAFAWTDEFSVVEPRRRGSGSRML
mmetsp:Transcript_6349/g.20882  ORF Transcript_6349/g.20882 Transcript_6349/m.20882 type:complete len:298 (-) Transcript_6349:77-970(-)|eukprot:CAMPEP_0185461102 /NCGR_PEP_ID=MMETSP1365-20130426/89081_1 /TAXON_ID=38817 /ORGANISM="Gephyrocapsa oceanica, Strain RCC1303" /LENGTH=297 /DNA_ID=CAMNT_0028067745 /DNA_START=21 /DNA_END=914 /DNA_ORIENTATION=-